MTKAVWVNGYLVKQRMHQLGLSERDTAETAHMTGTSIRSIVLQNALSTSFAVAHVRRLANALGVTWSELFSAPASQSEPCHDAQAIIQMLINQTRGHHPDRLARALGWDLERLEAAVEKAAGPLAAVGLVIHNASSGLLLRPAVDLSEAQARLDALQDDDEGLAQGPARVLYASYMGKLSATADRQDHHFYLGRLHNLGVLVDGRASKGGRHDLSSDFSFCLDF